MTTKLATNSNERLAYPPSTPGKGWGTRKITSLLVSSLKASLDRMKKENIPASIESICEESMDSKTDLALLEPGQVVVQIGCSDSCKTLEIANLVQPGGRVVSIDANPVAIADGRSGAVDAGVTNVEFYLCRVDSIPLPTASCDCVLSGALVCMAGSRMAVLREIVRVLKPGGNMVLHDVAVKRLLPPELVEPLAAHSYGLSGAIEPASYVKLLHRAGLSNVLVEQYDLQPQLHQLFAPSQGRSHSGHAPVRQRHAAGDSDIKSHGFLRGIHLSKGSTADRKRTDYPLISESRSRSGQNRVAPKRTLAASTEALPVSLTGFSPAHTPGQTGILLDYLTAVRICGQRAV